ncbi:MAG: hypothetical protein ACYTFI_15025 [Planctomycetota bacterium]|jgi:hypothetical protein
MQDEPANGEPLPLTEEDWKRHRESVAYLRTVSFIFLFGGVAASFIGLKGLLLSALFFVVAVGALLWARRDEARPPRRRRARSRGKTRAAHIRLGALSVILASAGVVVGTLWGWNWGVLNLIFLGAMLLLSTVIGWVQFVVQQRREAKKRDEVPTAARQQDCVPPPLPEPRPAKGWHIGCGLVLVAVALAAGVWSLAVGSEFGAGPIVFAVVLLLRIRHDLRRRKALMQNRKPD